MHFASVVSHCTTLNTVNLYLEQTIKRYQLSKLSLFKEPEVVDKQLAVTLQTTSILHLSDLQQEASFFLLNEAFPVCFSQPLLNAAARLP